MTETSNIEKKIKSLGPWFHNIHLPGGQQTAPDHFLGDFPNFKWNSIKDEIPEDLSGKTVLDIGCNAGFYSVKLASRGARVTAIDLDTRYLKQAKWVINQFKLSDKITLKQQQVYDIAHNGNQYDIVWFMGVFYHLRYPLLALDIISRKVKKLLIFQTLTMPGEQPFSVSVKDNYELHDRSELAKTHWPKMAFIENEFNGDPTNWWLANTNCIKALLRSSGFQIASTPGDEIYFCTPDPDNPGVSQTWNESEYLSAINKNWKNTYQKKIE